VYGERTLTARGYPPGWPASAGLAGIRRAGR